MQACGRRLVVQAQPAQDLSGGCGVGHMDRAACADGGDGRCYVSGEQSSEGGRYRPVGHALRRVERVPPVPGSSYDPGQQRDTPQQDRGRPASSRCAPSRSRTSTTGSVLPGSSWSA